VEPIIDHDARRRLVARFGSDAEPWFDELPALLARLRDSWGVSFGDAIPRGSVSVVFRCSTADGRAAVLKTTPDRQRLSLEAKALASWAGVRTPLVFEVDEDAGALLIEEIQPGAPLAGSARYPDVSAVASLLTALHDADVEDGSFPDAAQRIDYLFRASSTLYDRRPDLARTVPAELYERGHRLADRLARDATTRALLHGDLTPANVLDGGEHGLVAIDPAPCLGDPAFDAVDLLLWRAEDVRTIERRSEALASATGGETERMLAWCSAFAAMIAMEEATGSSSSQQRLDALLTLARSVAR
jgi:streptomycin 6-kinase